MYVQQWATALYHCTACHQMTYWLGPKAQNILSPQVQRWPLLWLPAGWPLIILQHLSFDPPFWPPAPCSRVGRQSRKQWPAAPGRSRQRATWQQPPQLVNIRAMYSAPFSRLPLRAANFLLLGYTNCGISILCWAATGSEGFTRQRWPLQVIVEYSNSVFLDFVKPMQLPFLLWSFCFSPFHILTFHFMVCMRPMSLLRLHLQLCHSYLLIFHLASDKCSWTRPDHVQRSKDSRPVFLLFVLAKPPC